MSEQGNNTVMDYAAHKLAPETTTPTTSETEIVNETPVAPVAEAPVETEIVETTPSAEQVTETLTDTIQQPDYSKFLSETTEGLFTDVDSFKSAIPKLKEYDTKVAEYESLVAKYNELEEKSKVSPFANEYVKTIDEMLRAGKSEAEIENFTKISRLNLDEISDVDAKVMVLVKNGYSEEVAKMKVEEQFPLSEYDEDSPKYAMLKEDLRISALNDRKELKEFKKDLSTVDNSAQEQANAKAEELKLAEIAKNKAHTDAVKQAIPKISETISGLGEINLNGKENDEAVKLNFDYNVDFKSLLPQKLEAFFLDGQMEINEENIQLAQKYIKADYLEQNFDAIAQSIYKHADALATERTVNKYENRTGLPVETAPVNTNNVDKEYSDFLNNMVKRR